MPVVFFEGFNNSDTDIPKIDPNYWTTNNPESLIIGTDSGRARTENALFINNRNTLHKDIQLY
jgi:hypothetical protein